jgi:hypothetical protein
MRALIITLAAFKEIKPKYCENYQVLRAHLEKKTIKTGKSGAYRQSPSSDCSKTAATTQIITLLVYLSCVLSLL